MKQADSIFTHFRDLHLTWVRFFTQVLAQEGLTLPQYAVLSQLAAYGDLPLTEISERLHISKPAVTSLVKRLEKEGDVERFPNADDQRSFLLRIQAQARRKVLQVQETILKTLTGPMQSLTDSDLAVLNRFHIGLKGLIEDRLRQEHKTRRSE